MLFMIQWHAIRFGHRRGRQDNLSCSAVEHSEQIRRRAILLCESLFEINNYIKITTAVYIQNVSGDTAPSPD